MLCEECGKNPATIHISTIIGENKKDEALCAACWQKRNAKILNGLNVGELLSKILGGGTQQKTEEKIDITCDKCGMSYEEFKKTGRLGCAHCYQSFGEQINTTLMGVHGHTHHVGKAPEYLEQELRYKQKMRELRRRMEEAVQNEEFEQAAELRDEIKALEKQQMQNGNEAQEVEGCE